MKTNAIIRIVLYSLAILILLGILLAGLGVGLFMVDFDSGNSSSWLTYSVAADSSGVVFDADAIQELEIEWLSGTITIIPIDNTDQIHITESTVSEEEYRMVCTQSGNKISIEFCEKNFTSFGLSNTDNLTKDLKLLVPADWVCQELDIDAASASLQGNDLVIEKIDFDGASGMCILDDCLVDELDLDTASGDVRFSGTLNNIDVDAMSANCRIEVSNVPKRIDLDSMSGDLDLTLPEYCGFTACLDTMSGDFHTDFQVSSSVGSKSIIYGDGACKINVSAMSGDVSIHMG